MPESLLHFFAELFNFKVKDYKESVSSGNCGGNGEEEQENSERNGRTISREKARKITSLYQTICYILHAGKEKTPLQVMVGMVTHNTCKSATLITILNRLELSISYDEVQRIKNRLASYVIESSTDLIPVPIHFDPNNFTVLAMDNFDHNCRTLSGLQSAHYAVIVGFQDVFKDTAKKPRISETTVSCEGLAVAHELTCQKLKPFQIPQ